VTTAHFRFDSATFGAGPSAARTTEPVPLSSSSILEIFNVTPPSAGVTITERSAPTLSAVWCAVTLVANTIASFPLHLYRRTADDSREHAREHPLSDLLSGRPNRAMSWFTLIQTMQAHVLLWGRAGAEIERDAAGRPIGLWPITPDRIAPDIDDDGNPYYVIDSKVPLESADMLWIPGLGFDGYTGYSPVRLARESLASIAAAEQYGANFFGGDGRPSGLLTIKGKLDPKKRKEMRDEWQSIYGEGKSGKRIAILADGSAFQPLSTPPDDAQFLETRKFGILEVARWFNVPPHMLKDLDRATFSNIEEQGADFLTYSILPWLVLWTQEMSYKLLTVEERRDMYFEHVIEHLLRAKVADRYTAYATARQWGWMSVNDVRRRENLPLLGPDGDVYMVPRNMQPSRDFLRPQEPQQDQRAGLLGPNGRSIQEYLRGVQ
jgi:HK97 family phage portal protein